MTAAQAEATTTLEDARNKSDRIKRETERELAAITARRDSINTQLSNVRQMLATLGGAAGLSALMGDALPADDGSAAEGQQPDAHPQGAGTH